MEDIKKLKREFFEQLDERQKRLYAALTAMEIGHTGVPESERLFGLHPNTIRRGKTDLLNLEYTRACAQTASVSLYCCLLAG